MREPDAHDGAGILAILLALVGAVGVVVETGYEFAAVVLLQAGFLLAPAAYARVVRLPFLRASGVSRLRTGQVLAVLAASLGSMWLLKGLMDFQVHGLGLDTTAEQERVERLIRRVDLGWGSLLLLVIVPAFGEELIFRGIMMRGFAAGFGPVRGLLYTTLVFAVLHYEEGPARPMLMVFLGLYFGTVVLLTGSLWAGILAHAVNNGAALLVGGIFGDDALTLRPTWWMLLLSAGVFFGALGWLAAARKGEPDAAGGL